jgi:hypothetical protein
MYTVLAGVAFVLATQGTLRAQQEKEFSVTPYGFVKADMYYVTGGEVASYGLPSLTCVSTATREDSGATGIGFTAPHSRFGLRGETSVNDMPLGVRVELDFWVIAANANANPRMRLAYGWIEPLEGLTVQFGQQWDIFSPLHPTTNNTNANLWFNGNYSFRRPALMLQYTHDFEVLSAILQLSAGEAAKEDGEDGWIGADNLSGIPMIQGRAAVKIEKIEVGVAGCYAAFGEDGDTTTTGVSVDATLPLHELFSFKGEFCYGENLHSANIFTKAGQDPETYGLWANVLCAPLDRLQFVLGGGNEHVIDAGDGIEDNMTVYGDVIVPIGSRFKVSGEYQWLSTSYVNGDECTAGIVDIAATVTF